MILNCVNHQRIYDLQSIASAFFPGESTTQGRPEITSELVGEPTRGCRTLLCDGAQTLEAFVPCEGEGDSAVRDAVKRSFFAVAVKYSGFRPSWGVFTGIRPAREFARMGLDTKAFAQVFSMSEEKARLCADIVRVRKDIAIPDGDGGVSLYISIPFCPTRCAYCSFISGAGEKMLNLIPDYMEALYGEIDAFSALVKQLGLSVRTVYIGGGTPAILSAGQLLSLTSRITERFGRDILEFTVELGRPDVITADKLEAVWRGGCDRICINPQTLNDDILGQIGRRHTRAQFLAAMEMAAKYPFKAVNCDLIAGLPGETAESFADSLDRIVALGAQNVTVHSLCMKQGSDYKTYGEDAIRSKTASSMVDYSLERLSACGYAPYYIYKQKHAVAALENTGWALGDTASLYNMIMMDDLGSVIGLGAGSSSKILGGASPFRVYSPKYPYEYLREAKSVKEKMARLEEGICQVRAAK